MNRIENAKIRSTFLGYEDHGILTCMLHMEGDGWGQGFGGYSFDAYHAESKTRHATAFGMQFISKILKTLEIESWEALKGTHCRIERSYEKIHRIGHLVKDQWFDPQEILQLTGVKS